MTGDDSDNLGHPVAHTPERAEKIGATAAATEAAMADLAAQLKPEAEPEQQSLMLDEMDEQHCLFRGPVEHVASILDDAKRARGRPKGSQNKANRQFSETLMRMGFKHPGLNLAAIANADPLELAAELSQPYRPKKGPHAGELVEQSVSPADALALILKANVELLPYFESKKAQPTDDGGDRPLGNVMIIGQMVVAHPEERRTINLTSFDAPDE
ncbi:MULTISPECIES: hypothetical protein [unclassified Rhizobium]|uniref:hypothetical protein n=1 Tax=unclassified Rhizobium TaxID=2613769 RepID=UPI0016140BBF|nr:MULTISPECIES: hypothetical protein [unclassified Rhizobium]MBB3385996.1 hypothetical protein [Rhizobium sp. BK098]MBB3617827.1 hypothetical protein [Rhizobium sp. BK609]MBB3683358.1 hypothetical protein [Rhizobium sp. BK612]